MLTMTQSRTLSISGAVLRCLAGPLVNALVRLRRCA
ncbi:hypothetical protein KY49_6969 [Burkholderia sp. MSHR3999]|nr:hypothetical protein KY49_6969 [Burkholderia sp. MSHR3999]